MILDTNAVSALFDADESLGRLLEPALQHHLPVIVIGEYRFGVLGSKRKSGLGKLLDRLVEESLVLNCDLGTADAYARIRDRLKKQGTPIPENDIWIAALSLQHHQPIVSRDRHFDHVAGLKRLDWSA